MPLEAGNWVLVFGVVINILVAITLVVVFLKKTGDVERTLRQELKTARDEAASSSRELRGELATGASASTEQVTRTLSAVSDAQKGQLETLASRLAELTQSIGTALDSLRATLDTNAKDLQGGNDQKLERIRSTVDEKLTTTLRTMRDELSKTLVELGGTQQLRLDELANRLRHLTESNQGALDRMAAAMDGRIKEMQEGNEKRLEEMRKTVDEKLQDTLERRLGESFKLVDGRLEAVQRGLGEMQSLASGVGDLKRVLTNVKARGTWAEVHLGSILEQVLAPGQYAKNVRTSDETGEVVEYAVCLPGPTNDPDARVWLPIDSKFPQEDYVRLQNAAEAGNAEEVQRALDGLARAVRLGGQQISQKYLNPPKTTDFAVMYLATEGLYAEVLRIPDLADLLQRQYRVVVAGPTTLAAVLCSVRMGFQTLAIEQRAGEVREVLAAVKTEFGKFGAVLAKVKRQLGTASRTIDRTGVRTRAMQRKLRSVEELPEAEAARVLGLRPPAGITEPVEIGAAEEAMDVVAD